MMVVVVVMYRWSPDPAMDKQPGYLKAVLNFILDTFEDFEKELRPEGKPYSVEANIEEVTNQSIKDNIYCPVALKFYSVDSYD